MHACEGLVTGCGAEANGGGMCHVGETARMGCDGMGWGVGLVTSCMRMQGQRRLSCRGVAGADGKGWCDAGGVADILDRTA